MTAMTGINLEEARADREFWGRLVESAVGAYLVIAEASGSCKVYYWRDRNLEVDFVVHSGRRLAVVEVKSSKARLALPGMSAFLEAFGPARKLLIGGDGIPVETFLSEPVESWFRP